MPEPGRSLYPGQYWARALCLHALGRTDEARDALDPVFAQLGHGCLMFAVGRADRLPWVVRLALQAGDNQRAAAAAAVTDDLARRNPESRLFAVLAAHARGLCEHDPGLLRQAVSGLARTEWPLAAAAAREDLARLLSRDQGGQPGLAGHAGQEAAEQLEAAYDTYTQASAHRDAARVRSALRLLGIRKRRPAVARPDYGWASLTRGELAVVEVVAQGCTNKEAAAQLYLSPDTVNTHLRHAFAKLGIRSRAELARLAASRPGVTT
jgi:DNA-binding CsgD family transcriptional regulator